MQIIFIIFALITGALVGWWITRFIKQQEEDKLQQQVHHLTSDYKVAVDENTKLRRHLKHVEQHHAKAVSMLDDENILATHEELAHTRRETEAHLLKLQEQEEYITHLTAQLTSIKSENNAKIGSGINFQPSSPNS